MKKRSTKKNEHVRKSLQNKTDKINNYEEEAINVECQQRYKLHFKP